MRYLVGFACVLAALAALPLSVSAQAAEEGATSKPSAEESTPSAEPTPEEPALQLKLDDAGVEVVPSGYVEMKLRQRVSKARAWLIATGVVTAIGVPMLALGATYDRRQPPSEGFDLDFSGAVLATVGGIMVFGGVFGMAVSGGTLGASKRKLRSLEQAHYGIPARTRRGYTLEEAELRLKRARIGLGVSAGISVLGVALLIPGVVGECRATYSTPPRCDPLTITGATFITAGVVGMIMTGFLSLRRTRDRDWLRPAHYGTPRRVQWDLARSRLVF